MNLVRIFFSAVIVFGLSIQALEVFWYLEYWSDVLPKIYDFLGLEMTIAVTIFQFVTSIYSIYFLVSGSLPFHLFVDFINEGVLMFSALGAGVTGLALFRIINGDVPPDNERFEELLIFFGAFVSDVLIGIAIHFLLEDKPKQEKRVYLLKV
jgi:hypothetical protein